MLSARVHPGESNSSYMLKGALDFLLSGCKDAATLRKHFVVRVVPMLNPDGVIYGNYRCSLLGVDLNRRWQSPSRLMHPTVFYAKRLLQHFAEEHEVALFCDMHGHSMRKNVFVYACYLKPQEETNTNSNVLIKLIPKLLSKTNTLFSFRDSHFRVEPCKLSTARVVAFKELQILNSYTLEASFYGPRSLAQLGNREPSDGETEEDAQMSTGHMESLGRDLCRVMLTFTCQKTFRRKLAEVTSTAKEVKEEKKPLKEAAVVPPVPVPIVPQPIDPLDTLFPTLETNREEDDEVFWAKVSAFEEQAYRVLYEQQMCEPLVEPLTGSEEQSEAVGVKTALEEIAQVPDVPEEMVKPDSHSEDGGSDSLASDNDDKKQEFLYRKSHPKKRRKKPSKVRSCNSRSHLSPESRPRTPFVGGNYPCPRAQVSATSHAVKAHRESPKPQKLTPTPVLLSGYRRASVGRAPRLKHRGCPSAVSLSVSKTPDLSLRLRCNRASDAYCDQRGSRVSLRSANASPTLY